MEWEEREPVEGGPTRCTQTRPADYLERPSSMPDGRCRTLIA